MTGTGAGAVGKMGRGQGPGVGAALLPAGSLPGWGEARAGRMGIRGGFLMGGTGGARGQNSGLRRWPPLFDRLPLLRASDQKPGFPVTDPAAGRSQDMGLGHRQKPPMLCCPFTSVADSANPVYTHRSCETPAGVGPGARKDPQPLVSGPWSPVRAVAGARRTAPHPRPSAGVFLR